MIDGRGPQVHRCARSSWPADLPRYVRRALGRAEMGSRYFAGSYALTLLAGLAIGVMMVPIRLALTAGAVAASVFVALIFVHTRIWHHGYEAIARDAMFSFGRCPSCAYELRAAPIQDDGCSVCPECGAAWRLTKSEAP